MTIRWFKGVRADNEMAVLKSFADKKYNFIIFKTVLLLFACLVTWVSCNSGTIPAKKEKKEDTGIHKTVERGPVRVDVDVDKKTITIADRLNLTIRVISDEDYAIELPGFGAKLEQFGIVDYHTTQPRLVTGNKIQVERSYILEPFLSGDYNIPPMKVTFRKKGEKEDYPHTIETEKITITVTSLLPEKLEAMKIHDILPPVDLPKSWTIWIVSGTIAIVLLVAGIIVFIGIRKYKQSKMGMLEQVIPAHELAFSELEQLIAENLIEKGDVKLFYHRISDILRRYIENRFGIHAPEQTTEEFLAGLENRKRFPDEYCLLLNKFLTHCDLVKFARHQPDDTDIRNTFDSCREFIIGTKQKDEKE